MAISFNNIPQNWRVPLYWVEVDPSQAGLPTQRQPALLIGQKLASGAWPADVPIAFSTVKQAEYGAGVGSQLARMAKAFLDNNAAHEIWALPVAEPSGGVAADTDVTITGPASANGILTWYIGGQRVQASVTAGNSATVVAAAMVAAINANTNLPVTATNASGVVTLLARWKGLTGNDIVIIPNLLGLNGGEETPAGLTVTFETPPYVGAVGGKLTAGAGAPDLTAAIAALGDDHEFEYVAFPFTDTTSLGLIETEYGFGDSGRWGWMRQLYGMIFSARRDSYSNLITFGATRNSPVISIQPLEPTMPTPVWEVAAAYAAKAARAFLNDPARPLQSLELTGFQVTPRVDRWSKSELNALSGAGLAMNQVSPNGNFMLMGEVSTYQKNVYGQSDDAYQYLSTLATLAWLFRDQKSRITNKFPRHKLADNGTRFSSGIGAAIVTPNVIRAELVAQYAAAEELGYVENTDLFKKYLQVERNPQNVNRVDVLYPPDIVNQLRMFAVLGQFRLQYNRNYAQDVQLGIA